MDSRSILSTLLVALSANVFFCWPIDEEPQSAFFADQETALRQEYLECTGDPQPVELKFIIDWKRRMDAWKETKECAELTRDYKKAFGPTASILPCKLLQWNERRKQTQDSVERALMAHILVDNESRDAAEELQALPSSPFDFSGIPFGISKASLEYLFTMKFNTSLKEKDAFLYAENVQWNGTPFLTAFFFDDDNRLYKYEAQSDALPADSLNRSVRPAAHCLARALEQSLGPPVHRYGIGFYEIKSRELAVEEKWETAGYQAIVGLSVLNYQYYAKAVVLKTMQKQPQPSPTIIQRKR
jgi:hypothetical protein